MSTRQPGDPLADTIDGDDTAASDLSHVEAPTYDHAPPTLEMRDSPFAHLSSQIPTNPGMGAPRSQEPFSPPVVTFDEMAGPTVPQGHPISMSWDGTSDPGWTPVDGGPTHATPPPKPIVPPPNAPKVEVSMSLQLEAAERTSETPMPVAPPPRYHVPQVGPGPHAPTYQLLPAMKRKEKKDSDWPLTVGLLVLAVVIALLLGAIAFGLVRTMRAGPRAETPSTGAAQ